jgi:RNase H-fold protein (predicted Holliday junction resolvase)
VAERSPDTEGHILAVDPGSEKLGLAVLMPDGTVVEKLVILRDQYADEISRLIQKYDPSLYAVGDGTGSKWVYDALAALVGGVIKLVPEAGTTLEARDMAWKAHPPGGLWRVLPKLFWPVPRDIDAWAAVVIGKRAIGK